MSTSPLQGYDQIVAVSQDHINMSLDARFSDEKLLKWDVKVSGIGHLAGHMLPPTVALFIPNEPAKTHFCLHFDSGNLTYYTYTDEEPPMPVTHVVDVTDWKLAFMVNLNLDAISKLPDDLAKKITFPGSYSVKQLLLDFTTADLMAFDPKLSVIPASDTVKPLGQDPKRDQALADMINTYLREQVLSASHNVLGYAITVDDPAKTNPIAPSFPPTLVRFQTMAHQPTSSGNDCILFLEMTDKHPFPTQPYIGWTWNWISEDKLDARHAGSMVVTIITLVKTTSPSMDEREEWKRIAQAADAVSNAWTTTAAHGMGWDWKYENNFDEPNFHHSRSCDTKVDVAPDVTDPTAIAGVWDIEATVTYGFRFSLNVAAGALGFSPTANPEPDCKVKLTAVFNDDGGSKEIPSLTKEKEEEVRKAVKAEVDKEMPSFVQQINDAFKHQAQFVFPGGGTFFMKDPGLNAAGDMVVGLTYKQE
ncbi:hypothetical protein MSAN_01897900 [Mycena sanguinolenta]|uniref:Uncharacterized protein n=1 Tax=Mycena sanguinolenta TaxID=230812 RepID=A0A8H6XRN1_9AGAR|nr:hypothetical protein MSAN_01897900 [Mycena sanguinolenta]